MRWKHLNAGEDIKRANLCIYDPNDNTIIKLTPQKESLTSIFPGSSADSQTLVDMLCVMRVFRECRANYYPVYYPSKLRQSDYPSLIFWRAIYELLG